MTSFTPNTDIIVLRAEVCCGLDVISLLVFNDPDSEITVQTQIIRASITKV
jgi:hypothetical protein